MRPHVLLVEPNPITAELLSLNITAAMPTQIIWLPSAQATLEFVEAGPHLDLALVRWNGKNLASAKVAAALRRLQPDLPILLVVDDGIEIAQETIDLLDVQGILDETDEYAEVAQALIKTGPLARQDVEPQPSPPSEPTPAADTEVLTAFDDAVEDLMVQPDDTSFSARDLLDQLPISRVMQPFHQQRRSEPPPAADASPNATAPLPTQGSAQDAPPFDLSPEDLDAWFHAEQPSDPDPESE